MGAFWRKDDRWQKLTARRLTVRGLTARRLTVQRLTVRKLTVRRLTVGILLTWIALFFCGRSTLAARESTDGGSLEILAGKGTALLHAADGLILANGSVTVRPKDSGLSGTVCLMADGYELAAEEIADTKNSQSLPDLILDPDSQTINGKSMAELMSDGAVTIELGMQNGTERIRVDAVTVAFDQTAPVLLGLEGTGMDTLQKKTIGIYAPGDAVYATGGYSVFAAEDLAVRALTEDVCAGADAHTGRWKEASAGRNPGGYTECYAAGVREIAVYGKTRDGRLWGLRNGRMDREITSRKEAGTVRAEEGFSFVIPAGFAGRIYLRPKDALGNTAANSRFSTDRENGITQSGGYLRSDGIILETEELHRTQTRIRISPDRTQDGICTERVEWEEPEGFPDSEPSGSEKIPLYQRNPVFSISAESKGAGIRSLVWSLEGEETYTGMVSFDLAGRMTDSDGVWEIAETDRNLASSIFCPALAAGDGDGIFRLTVLVTDWAGMRSYDSYVWCVDTVPPRVRLRYDQNQAENRTYFNQPRKAVIQIREEHFSERLAGIRITAYDGEKKLGLPKIQWFHQGNLHTAEIPFQADGSYTLSVRVSDRAGNRTEDSDCGNTAAPYAFTIDTKSPKITVKDLEPYITAALTQGSIRIRDANFAEVKIGLKRERLARSGESIQFVQEDVTDEFLSGKKTTSAGITVSGIGFPEEAANDGIYELSLKALDLAGNTKEKKCTFVVDRFGSCFQVELPDGIKNGRITGNVSGRDAVIVHEYNPAGIDQNAAAVTLTRDGRVLRDVEIRRHSETAEQASGGWAHESYLIPINAFSQDGLYQISLQSQDRAGHRQQLLNEEKRNYQIQVDQTAPKISEAVLENGILSFSAFDAMGLSDASLCLGERTIVSFSAEGQADWSEQADLLTKAPDAVPGENGAQELILKVTDLAGHETQAAVSRNPASGQEASLQGEKTWPSGEGGKGKAADEENPEESNTNSGESVHKTSDSADSEEITDSRGDHDTKEKNGRSAAGAIAKGVLILAGIAVLCLVVRWLRKRRLH